MKDPGKDNLKKMNSGNTSTEQLILERSSLLRVPGGKPREEALEILKARIALIPEKQEQEKTKTIRLSTWISAVAAVMLLLIGLWRIFVYDPETKITADYGSITHYRLPDGSSVSLNAGSWMTFKRKGFRDNRNIRLNGEAFFEVTKGNSFTVSSDYGTVKVLGTSFNFNSREYSFSVSCLSGRIEVSADEKSVIIEPGQTAKLANRELLSYADNKIENSTGWLKGEFHYENTPLNYVFEEIERQFNVDINGKEAEGKFFTGGFDTKDLNIALEEVCLPMGMKYEIGKNGKISVSD